MTADDAAIEGGALGSRSVFERVSARESVTQSLPYAAAQQQVGSACLLAGAGLVVLRPSGGQLRARMIRPAALDLETLDTVMARTGVTTVQVEPAVRCTVWRRDGSARVLQWVPGDDAGYAAQLEALGWSAAGPGAAHTSTRVLDVAGGVPAAVAQMSAVARRNVRKAAAATGVRYASHRFDRIEPPLLAEIHDQYDRFVARQPTLFDQWPFTAALVRGFAQRGWFVTAHRDDAVVGVVVLLLHDAIATYYAAFSVPEARAERVPTGLVHHAMEVAVREGCDLFDLMGVWDPRYPERAASWRGFSEFKKRFGGELVALPPAFDITSA
ncbi:MAG: GNAT family N-acetyltransferase [Deltaproteobacteria bacterium]|nr:GNAT family N-acetyltransferase [Deltaproteobacteria bacterium]